MAAGQPYNIIANKAFRQSLDGRQLSELVCRQVNLFIPDPTPVSIDEVSSCMDTACTRLRACFRWIRNKYYCNDSEVIFDHFQSDQYCAFIYLLSNTAWLNGNIHLATKLFLLNKYLHALDLYYSVRLPEVFMLVHPVGSVIGNAEYGNFFVAYQNCTVGSVLKDGAYIYPTIGSYVVVYARAAVLGSCQIGNNVSIAANAFVYCSRVPDNSVVTGAFPSLNIRQADKAGTPFFY